MFYNPSLFQGEQSFGTTAGAPLSTDANNQLISGTEHGEVSATASATAPTGADTLIAGMTTTPAAGTYLAWFSCDLNSANAGAVVTLSFYVGGTINSGSQRKVMPFAGGTLTSGSQRVGVATNALVVVNGAQAVEVRWSTSSNAPTAAARTMNWLRVA